MKSSPDLVSMPNEILANICTYAHDGDKTKTRGEEWLRAVRLTCKQLHVPATIEFGKQFLASLPVMAARGGLETLVEICKHPLFGPRVNEIQLHGWRASGNHLSSLCSNLAYLDDLDLHEIREIRRQLNMVMDFLEEQFELEMCEGIFELLKSALKIIRDHGSSVTLSVITNGRVKPLGYARAMEQLLEGNNSELKWAFRTDRVRSTLHVLLVAAARSGCPVHGLKILESDISEDEFNDDLPDMDTACKEDILSTVKVFHMRLSHDKFLRQFQETLNIVLQRTKNLVEFNLRIEDWHEDGIGRDDINICAQTFCSVQSRSLRKLELHDAPCRQRDLLTLLDKNKDTLEDLRLTEVTLLGCWSEVFVWIRGHCSLKFLSVYYLFEFGEDAYGYPLEDAARVWAGKGFGGRDESGDLFQLDEFLEQKRKEQASLEGED
jgi:hypothetical protein